MPPQKNAEQSSDAKRSAQKPPKVKKKRVKAEKPKLQTPTILKVKIQKKSLPATSSPLVSPLTAAQSKAQNAVERKIELANEVALSQLTKKPNAEFSCPLANSLLATAPNETGPAGKKTGNAGIVGANKKTINAGEIGTKKRGRKKKVVDPTDRAVAPAIKSEANDVKSPEHIPVGPVKKKAQGKRKVQQIPKLYDETLDFIFDEPVPKKPKKIIVKKAKKIPVTKSTKKQANSSAKLRIQKEILQKAKLKIDNVSIASPSLLDREVSLLENKVNEKDIPFNLEQMEVNEMDSFPSIPAAISRVNSYASECPSWAKDISSSSSSSTATTLTMLPPNDLAKIDNRVPIVKLDNIDKVLQEKAIINADDDESRSSESRSSTDSESSDSVTKCTRSSPCFTDFNSRSLNLSRSSISNADKITKDTSIYEDFDTQSKNSVDLDFLKSLTKGYENITEKDIQGLKDDDWPDDEREIIILCQELRKIFKRHVTQSDNTEDKQSMEYDKGFTITRTVADNENTHETLNKKLFDNKELSNTTPKILLENINNSIASANILFDNIDNYNTTTIDNQEMSDPTTKKLFENKEMSDTATENLLQNINNSITKAKKLFDNINNSNTTTKKLFDNTENLNMINKKHYESIKRTIVGNNISIDINNTSDVLDLNTTDIEDQYYQETDDRTNQEIVKIANDQLNPDDTNHNVEQEIPPQAPAKEPADTDWYRNKNYSDDDDDVLSLTAESITGLESIRFSSTASLCAMPPDYDEYQPEPPPKTTTQRSYVSVENDFNQKATFEKENEDTAEINKENTQQRSLLKDSQYEPWTKGIVLLASSYTQSHPYRCQFLKGVCFFNLISNCNRPHCIYLHAKLDRNVVLNRLERLPGDVLICDYMLIRDAPDLRRQFGLLFAYQFRRRNLTRVLVEMVIDFIVKARPDSKEDYNLKIMITENTLEHLTNVNLTVCEDLLHYKFSMDCLLCDKLMEALAETQNFARFKETFIKLADFMIHVERSFDVSVASQILLRVCILPFDPALVTTIWRIISNTNDKIFSSSSMVKFEEYVFMLDKDLHEQFLAKKQIAFSNHPEWISPAPKIQEYEREFDEDMVQEREDRYTRKREERYTSPDTTKMYNMPKPQMERKDYPTFRGPAIPSLLDFKIPCLSSSARKVRANVEYRSPLQKPSFRYRRGFSYRPSFQSWMKPTLNRQVSYEKDSNYQRRSGPSDNF